MGQAREVMDRLTAAITQIDFDSVAKLYAADAVIVTPDQGEIRGREAIIEYFRVFSEGFADMGWESLAEHEAGNVAIDEGFFLGTNTGPLPSPSGETIPATGKQIRVRECDIAVVEGGMVTRHHFYFDQMEFLGQLGLLPDELT